MRLLEIRADPIAHFLPTKTTPNGTFFCAAPPGLPPSLAEMFMFPTTNLRRARTARTSQREEEEEDGEAMRTPKRARISVPGEEEELSVEYGMERERSERARSLSERPFGDVTVDVGGDDLGALGEVQPFDVGDVTLDVSMGPGGRLSSPQAQATPKSRAQSLVDDEVRSRYSTPGLGRTFDDAECAIAAFDHRTKGAESQTQTSESEVSGGSRVKGVSKNTALAIGLLQERLAPEGEEGGEEKVVSFAQVANKVRLGSQSGSERRLMAIFRHHVVQPRPSFSSCSFSARETALKSLKAMRSQTSRSAPRTGCGSNKPLWWVT